MIETIEIGKAFDVAAVRKHFPALSREVKGKPLVYFDNAATTQKPQAVIDALVDYYSNYNANIHRGIHTLAEEATAANESPEALAAKRQREKERRAREPKASEAGANVAAPTAAEAVKPSAKRVVVTVTYDESGRVTQASGGDANALRIARQKRFPAGKPGSATISIPIN